MRRRIVPEVGIPRSGCERRQGKALVGGIYVNELQRPVPLPHDRSMTTPTEQ